jgi:urease accessory protein
MRRAIRVIAGDHRHDAPVVDTLLLTSEQRQNPHGAHSGLGGVAVMIDLEEPLRLRSGDCLVLEDGGLVEILAEAEPLIEARAADLPALARLAWHLGDRHVPVQILERRLRLRRDPAIETLLESLGARLTEIEAPFDPEGGAYAHDVRAHDHDHDHHDHDHHGHDHSHDHAHDHGHAHHDHDHHGHDHGERRGRRREPGKL